MYKNYELHEVSNFDTYKLYKNEFKNEICNNGIKCQKIENGKKIQCFIRELSFFEKIETFFQLSLASCKNWIFTAEPKSKQNLKLAWKHLAEGQWVRTLTVPILEKKPNLSALSSAISEEPNPTPAPIITTIAPVVEKSEESSVEIQPILKSDEISKEVNNLTDKSENSFLLELKQKYTFLTDEEKDDVRSKVNDIANEIIYGCGRNVDFVNSAITQKEIHRLSQLLFSPFKENLIFSLGQSPAWFAAMAQLDQPKPERFSFVAFSGDWYGLFDDHSGKEMVIDYEGRSIARKKENVTAIQSIHKDFRLQFIEENKPTQEQTKCFRSYLSRIGCSPKRIMEQKEPAVIVDYVNRAGGLKSFLEILFTWAEEEGFPREEFKCHLKIQCMYDLAAELLGDEENAKAYLQANLGQYSSSEVIAFPLTENDYSPETEGIRNLFSKERTIISEQRRLIKRFTPALWTEENCNKSSFAEHGGEVNPYIEAIYANFICAVEKIKKYS